MDVDRAETPEYFTPPQVQSQVTTPLIENSIPLPVRVDLGVTPLQEIGQENLGRRCFCCRPVCNKIPGDETETPEEGMAALVRRNRLAWEEAQLNQPSGSSGVIRTHHRSARKVPFQTCIRSKGRAFKRELPSPESSGESEEDVSSSRRVPDGRVPEALAGGSPKAGGRRARRRSVDPTF